MKRIVFAAALALVASSALASDLVIKNKSLWDIHRIYLSSSDDDSWGEDQLDDDILKSGQTLRLHGVSCDSYDVKLVDEDGDVCELRGVKLCGDEAWTIDDDALLSCQRNSN
ncbi:hypothetical protein [Arenimonas oryziterrae]|uniref:Uncharacterized protein n=1 Tax=Arenimonas oryziterrae DSM 21050 = YC6267 TaxID=1121015 RepID=A0A091BIJ7_9GAMM|nr:hypothetical protein [Arenimonas oryziterrae]KFN44170.1 hypothetical protein N789_07065 [Arenimonas oryziterrae DSM 21050 = YC6267]